MMGQAICHLHWTADLFWRATPHEFYSACEAGEISIERREKRDPWTPTPEFLALRDAHAGKEVRP